MRADALTAGAAPVAIPRPKRRREVRDPYDGLRPWSAITHGVGAVLAAAVNVKNNIISIALVSVNQTHFFEILSCKLYLKNPGQISSVLNSLQKSGELFLQVPCPLIFSGTVHSASQIRFFYFKHICLLSVHFYLFNHK